MDWISGNYPERLTRAIYNSSTVISAWEADTLVGLVNALDDGALAAYAHYLLVHPAYQAQGIGRMLVQKLKEKYKDFLYLLLVAEKAETVPFYTKLSFKVEAGMTPLYIMNTQI